MPRLTVTRSTTPTTIVLLIPGEPCNSVNKFSNVYYIAFCYSTFRTRVFIRIASTVCANGSSYHEAGFSFMRVIRMLYKRRRA
jgi:hypothetical protein